MSKPRHGWFELGDTVITWPIYSGNNGNGTNKDFRIGKVIETGDPAIIDWGTQRPTKVSFSIQFATWNRDSHTGFRLYRKNELAKNKKLCKFKIGDMVEIITSEGYHPSLEGRQGGRNYNGLIGIITQKLVDDMYVQIYLQTEMKYVWREIHEIRKA